MRGKKNTFIFVQSYKIKTMTWTSFWNAINAIFQFCFKIIHKIQQAPNILVWIILISLLAYWTFQLGKQVKEAKEKGIQP